MDINQPEIFCSTLDWRDKRSLIFHLLYAAESFNYETSLESIVDNFGKGFGVIITPVDDVFQETASIIEQRQTLDEEVQPLLDNWRLDRLGTSTRLIMRLGLWELINLSEDSALIIDGCIELAKCFAEQDSFKFINGVLDKFATKVRGQAAEAENK